MCDVTTSLHIDEKRVLSDAITNLLFTLYDLNRLELDPGGFFPHYVSGTPIFYITFKDTNETDFFVADYA